MKTGLKITLAFATAASVALAGAALAHPHEGGDADGDKKIQQVIILSNKDGKDTDKRIRGFRMMKGEGGTFACPDGKETKVDETTGGERTKILICSNDKLSDAERADKLEETLAKMRDNNSFAGEHKAKVESALQDAIARLRSRD